MSIFFEFGFTFLSEEQSILTLMLKADFSCSKYSFAAKLSYGSLIFLDLVLHPIRTGDRQERSNGEDGSMSSLTLCMIECQSWSLVFQSKWLFCQIMRGVFAPGHRNRRNGLLFLVQS